MPELSPSQQLLTLQYVAIGLPRPTAGPQTGAKPGFCLATEYSTPCDAAIDAAVCGWHNVRVGQKPSSLSSPQPELF